MNPSLTPRQNMVIDNIMSGMNKAEACLAAGYKGNNAYNILKRPAVRDELARRQEAFSEKVDLNSEWVLRKSRELLERCMQEIDPVLDNKGEQVCDKETGRPMFTFNAAGAAKALELVGKNRLVKAFAQQVEHTGEGGKPLAPMNLIQFVINYVKESSPKKLEIIEGDYIEAGTTREDN